MNDASPGAATPPNLRPDARPAGRYRGEAVYLFAFDIAYELRRLPAGTLLGQPVAEFWVDPGKRTPRQLFFYRPQMIRLPPVERIGPRGPVRVEQTLKLLPVGAVSLAVHVPFEVADIEDLVVYHDLAFTNGSVQAEARQLAEQVAAALAPHCVRPVRQLVDDEAYTVFCLEAPMRRADGVPVMAEDWLRAHRRSIASLLTQETDVGRLSRQEATESTDRFLSYYEQDLVVLDWDAALVVDERRNFEEVLYVMELANLQLAELEAYDRLLDDALDRSYRDLAQSRYRGRTEVLRDLREIRIDLARFTDELSNITKFFGDWHLARVYETLCARFHLSDWHRAIESKLKTLDDLYQLLQHDQNNRWMLILELTIVLLFIIDLVLLFAGSH